ncbi:MAG TPA: hypothetical protein VGM86_05655 [Thermoanaerobaculia bacterium]|jgi:hypothetical protein
MALTLAGAAGASDWQWSFTPYLWLASAHADVSVNDKQILNGKADFGNAIHKIDFVASAHFEGQKGRNGFLLDGLYLDLSGQKQFELGSLSGPAGALNGAVGTRTDLSATILEAAGIYNPRGDGTGFSILYGARVFDVREQLRARYEFANGGSVASQRYDASATLYDGMIGARFVGKLSDHWQASVRADVSEGGTDLTWNSLAGLGYSFGDGGRYTMLAGYRYMHAELKNKTDLGELKTTLELSGAYVAFKLGF